MMAYWNSETKKTIYSPARDIGNGWFEIDCGCCGGIAWGCLEPIECDKCKGTGSIFWHKKSKVFALYPGGPFVCGKGDLTEREIKGGVIDG
jgi:hypothetical protein